MRVAAAIPALDAAATVGEVVRRARPFVGAVLVVDDGSRDATASRAAAAGAAVVRHARNEGKGAAMRTAMRRLFAEGWDAVVTVDADGQHAPEEIPALLEAARDGADLVLGSRVESFSGMCALRRASNRFSAAAIGRLAGVDVEDPQTGFRLYTRRLFDALDLPEPGFEAESAILVRAARRGFRVRSTRVRLEFADGRATSHYRPVVDTLRIARAVVRARWEPPLPVPEGVPT